MKKILILIITATLFSCGASQSNSKQNSTAVGMVFENVNVIATHQTMPKGIFIRRLSGPREMYKVSTPLEDGKRYRVTFRITDNTSNVKEAKITAYTQL